MQDNPYTMTQRRVRLTVNGDMFTYEGFVGDHSDVGVWLHRDDGKIQFFPWTSVRHVILE